MGKETEVVWFIEHEARELHVGCAVRHLLQSRFSTSAEVLPYYHGDPGAVAARLRPRVVVIPYSRSAGDPGLTAYLPSWRDAVYLNLSWEELRPQAELHAMAPRDTFARKHVIHHAWCEDFRQYLLENGVPEEHVFLNGHPAFQFYDEPYRRFFLRKEELARTLGLDPTRKWLFFPENYSWGFLLDHSIEVRVQMGFDREAVYEMREYCLESFRTVLGWLGNLASREDVEVILRPRPATTLADFAGTAEKTIGTIPPRLHITKEGTVREWILASDVVASSFSTTLIEAAVAKLPAFKVEPIPMPDPFHADWQDRFRSLRTEEEFLAAVREEDGKDGAAESWARSTLMGGGDAIFNLAEFVSGLCRPGAARPPVPTVETITPPAPAAPGLKDRLRYYRQLPAIMTRRYRAGKSKVDREQDRFSPEEVERLTAAFGDLLAAHGGRG